VGPLTVSEVARIIGVQPRRISDLLYTRALPDSDFPVVGGRRLIRPEQIDNIRAALTRAARNSGKEAAVAT
jgi:hypothetical protein